MRYFTTLLCASFLPFFLIAQEASVSGRILNGTAPAEFVNVILLSATDSSVVKLELADQAGAFRFAGLDAGAYYLRTSGIGYADLDHPSFTLADDENKQLDAINLEATVLQLETVEVVGRKPFLEQKAGRLVVNVSDNITGQGGTVTDLLKKVPGVIVIGEQVSMAGKSGLTILIDGRPTKFMDIQSLLREMPADNIKSIEVIHQPGAALDAEGSGGVINIILKKNSMLGTNGSVYAGAGYGELAKYRTGGNLNYRSGGINLMAGLGLQRNSWIEGLDLDRVVGNELFEQRNFEEGFSNGINGNLGVDVDLTDRHRVGVSARGFYSQSPYNGENRTRILAGASGEPLSTFVTNNSRERQTLSLNTDAFYRWKIDTSGQQLTLDGSYSRFTRDNVTQLTTTGDLNVERTNDEPALAGIYTAQLDYQKPFGTKWRLESGLKFSAARLDNEIIAQVKENGTFVRDPRLSNHYLYNEDIYAAYGQVRYQGKGFDAAFGLRYEQTATRGNNLTIDSINVLDYGKLFPSLSLSVPLTGPLGLALAYSYRIERPNYYDLNPFIGFIDPLTFSVGNPFLRPELIHSGSVSLTYEKQPFFNLSYDRTNDVLSQVTQQDDVTGEAFQTTVNLDNYTRYGGQLFFPLDFIAKPISGYAGVMGYYHDYSSDYLGGELNNDQWSWTAFSQVNVNLPSNWKLEVTGWWQGPGLDGGILRSRSLYGVDAGIQKKFLDDRMTVQLSADGIVQEFFRGNINFQNQQMDIVSYWEAPVFRARVTYRFGNRFLKNKDKVNSSGSEARERVNMK